MRWLWMTSAIVACGAAWGCGGGGGGDDGSQSTTSPTTSVDDGVDSVADDGGTVSATGVPDDDGGSADGGSVDDDGADPTGLECPPLLDDEVGPAVAIRVTNARAEAIWLPVNNYCYFSVPYAIAMPDGEPLSWSGPDCGTCELNVVGSCECPGAPCFVDTLMYLEAGASYENVWSGGMFVTEDIAPACPGAATCGPTCQHLLQAPDGRYSVSAIAGSSASGCATPPCGCEPISGVCTVADPMAVVDDPATFMAAFAFPTETMVEITIE